MRRPYHRRGIPERPPRNATSAPAPRREFQTAWDRKAWAVGTTTRTAGSIASRRYDSPVRRDDAPIAYAALMRRAETCAAMQRQIMMQVMGGLQPGRATLAHARSTRAAAAQKCRSKAVRTTPTEASTAIRGATWPVERRARPRTPTLRCPDLRGNLAPTRTAGVLNPRQQIPSKLVARSTSRCPSGAAPTTTAAGTSGAGLRAGRAVLQRRRPPIQI